MAGQNPGDVEYGTFWHFGANSPGDAEYGTFWHIGGEVTLFLSVSVFDGITVTEYIDIAVSPSTLYITVTDGISASEYREISLSDLGIGVSDDITIGEYLETVLGDMGISVVDSIAVAEEIFSKLSALGIDVSEDITLGEFANLATALTLLVQDAVTVSETPPIIKLGDLEVLVSDGITIDELRNIWIEYSELAINVLDSILVDEGIGVYAPIWKMFTKDGVEWKIAIPYYKSSGSWIKCKAYVKIDGIWVKVYD